MALDPGMARSQPKPRLSEWERDEAMRGLFYSYAPPRDQLWAFHEITELRQWVIAFGAPWAARHAEEWGLPKGHLFPTHYDILARCGARMDDFVRHDAPTAEPAGCVGAERREG